MVSTPTGPASVGTGSISWDSTDPGRVNINPAAAAATTRAHPVRPVPIRISSCIARYAGQVKLICGVGEGQDIEGVFLPFGANHVGTMGD